MNEITDLLEEWQNDLDLEKSNLAEGETGYYKGKIETLRDCIDELKEAIKGLPDAYNL